MDQENEPTPIQDLDPILQQIDKAHANPDDEALTESAIVASVDFLQRLPVEIHWLCNSSPLLRVIVQAIQLWGYGEPPAQATLAKFKPVLANALARCANCALEWHLSFRKELHRVFREVYSYDEMSTSEFYIALDEWDQERIIATLRHALQVTEKLPMAWKHNEVKVPLLEALADANLFLKDDIYYNWKDLFLRLEKLPSGVGEKFLPGAVVLLFDADPRLRSFGEQLFRKRSKKLGSFEFGFSVRKGFEIQLKRQSKLINEGDLNATKTLWEAVNVVLRESDPQLVQTALTSSPFDLLRLLISHFSSSGPHFLSMLTVLTFFLQTFSSNIWQRISSTPLNLIDQIFSNPSFENLLLHPDTVSTDGELSGLLEWLPKFMSTQSEQAKVPILSKFLYFAFEVFNHARFPERSRTFCLREGMGMLAAVMEESLVETGLIDKDVDLALKLDIIQMAEKYAATIVRNANANDSRATRVLGLRLQLDCRVLETEMKELIKPDLYRGRLNSNVTLSEMWKIIETRSWSEDDTNLIRAVLASVGRAATFDLLDSHNFETKDVERVKRFSKAVFELHRYMVLMFNKMTDIRPRTMRSILEDASATSSVVANLFNAKRQNLENANLNMLKTTYDVSGKLDLWKQLLRVSFDPTLRGVSQITQQILFMQRIYPPEKVRQWHRGYLLAYVAKIIRQSMQIVDILCSGRSGILTTTDILQHSDSNTSSLLVFWRTFWEVLNIAIISATAWAEREDKDVMKNFLRDVLEGASALFDALKCLDASLSGTEFDQSSPVKVSLTQRSLLKDMQTPLASLSKWLCLNVDELRETTLTVAIRILKRFARAEVQVREDTLVQYYRLAHGKKKNNMSEEQRERLLYALSEHDVEPTTRKAVQSMAATRIAGRMTPPPQINKSGRVIPELAKVKSREVIDLSEEKDFLGDYLTDSELSEFMDRLEKKTPVGKTPVMKQTKLDFSKGVLKPPGSTSITRTTSMLSKPVMIKDKAPPPPSNLSGLAQLRADFRADRLPVKVVAKAHRAPVEAPKTDAFGRPLDAAGKVIEPPRPPPRKIEESSSSESDSDSDGGGLFSIAKENKSPPKIRRVEKRKVQLLGEPVPSRIQLQAQERALRRAPSERQIRARLDPDLTSLLTRILAWTPSHNSPFPPNTGEATFKRVAASFPSPNKYEETFEPLLMLECWQHIQQAKSEGLGESFDFMIENRQKIDDYVGLFITMKNTTWADAAINDPDLIIISNTAGSGGKECFARVKGIKKKPDSVELSLRCIPSPEIASLLVPKARMFGVKLFSLTPIMREYAALKGLPFYDLVEEILAARPSTPVQPTDRELKVTMDAYAVNKPQAIAIVGACQKEGFSLIQGPPGTGKTKTILGIVGAVLTGNAIPGATSIAIPGESFSAPPPKPRLLLCAPSNAAVDEIVLRLIGGIRNAQGEKFKPKIVRVGKSDSINANVRSVTLDELVDQKLEARVPQQTGDVNEQSLRAELNKVLEQRNAKGAEYDRAREIGDGNASNLAAELKELNAKKNRIGAQLDEIREKRLALIRDRDVSRRQITDMILDEADVICATLSGSGHEQLAKMKVNFETVIIDEAAQSIELASLIPLKYGCQRCILVGDPNQLPPTVLSQAAAKFLYEESLFVRMQRNHPKSVYLLSIQYRMHPGISAFPSAKFYDGKLLDGPDMATITAREWHGSPLFRPYLFFNVHGGEQERGARGVSLLNRAEVNIASQIYDRLTRDFGHIDFGGKIGIVTPYKEQLRELLRHFRRRYGEDITNSIDFNTIDGFQGQEKDIIILSCVRAAQDSGVGFLKDIRRINVALTRAKSTLLILGNKAALVNNGFWRDLINDAEKRRALIDCGAQTFAQPIVPSIKSSHKRQIPTGPAKVVPTGPKSMLATAGSSIPTGPSMGSAKARASQFMGELIPLGQKATIGSKAAPVMVDSDTEMPDAKTTSESLESDSFSDSDIVSSLEEGEVMDIDTPIVVPKAKSKKQKSKVKSKDSPKELAGIKKKKPKVKEEAPPEPPRHSLSPAKKRKKSKDKEPEWRNSEKSPDKLAKETIKNGKDNKPATSSSITSAPPQSPAKPPLKRPAQAEPVNPPVYKRKAGPANLFITKKPKPAPASANGIRPTDRNTPATGEKKESVKARLARQMRPPI